MSAHIMADPDYHRELRDAQVAYTRRGWATVELRPPIGADVVADETERRRATRPLNKGWPELAVDPRYSIDDRVERIVRLREEYTALGIGLVMGPQLDGHRYHVAIDEDEPDALAQLAAQHEQTVTSTWRQTARRGSHYVYMLTARQALVVDLLHGRGGALHVHLPGIDVLGARRYIVGAPSMHRDGEHRYTIVDDREPSELPDWVWKLILIAATPTRPQHEDPDLTHDEIDRRWPYAYRLRCAERLCETHPEAIQSQPSALGVTGWPTTMRLVGSIVTGLAVERDDAIDLVMRVYSPRCVPPWSREEIEYMVARAIAQPYRARGWLLAQQRWASAAVAAAGSTSPAQPTPVGATGPIRGGESGRAAALDPPILARAEVVCVDERPGHGAVWYRIIDGPRAGLLPRRRPMAWPPTDRSRGLWDAIARAVGLVLDAITHPDAQLRGRTVRIEILDDGGEYAWRLGRVYPDNAGTAPPPNLPPLPVLPDAGDGAANAGEHTP